MCSRSPRFRLGSALFHTPAIMLLAVAAGCASRLERRFQHHIDYLASDRLEGRGVGSRGIELAADYIVSQFAKIGLEPAGESGTYFQTFDMTLHRTLSDASRLTVVSDPVPRKLGRDFIPFSFSSGEAFDGDVVFCGYGISAPDRDRDDFVHADLGGKIALMFRGEPPSWADDHGNATPHAMFRNKVYNAKDRGAAAVLIVNQRPDPGASDALVEFDQDTSDAYGLPAFHITRALAETLLAKAGAGSLDELQKRMDAGSYVSTTLDGVRVSGQAVFEKNAAPTRNVIGLLRGHGPLAHEYVVVGAHYDHLGIRKPMARVFKKGKLVVNAAGPQIHNGADDNASGTSGMIEVARLLANGPPLNRSVLFIAFTAEESGLHGSKRFVEHPTVPFSQITAMLNLDMIGRMPPGRNSVQVFGLQTAPEFSSIVAEAAGTVGLKTVESGEAGGRSDHASFVRRDIPCLYFSTGTHRDYHKPSDDSDKINSVDGARVTRLVGRVATALAMSNRRPSFQQVTAKQSLEPGGTPTYKVVMGLAPAYGDDGQPGMGVDDVSSDGPADLAGMKAGDRIIRIDGKKVENIYDYMAATRNNKPGDEVAVVVLRDGAERTLHVTLAAAR